MGVTLKAVEGCIVGTAVGDSLGLPYEGLSPRRASLLFPRRDKHHFFLHFGMISDDTEHTIMVAQSAIDSREDPELFSKRLAGRLRRWLAGIPAGIGFATLRAILKLCLGYSPLTSGVFSAGNGPAMRSAILGVVYGSDDEKLKQMVFRSTVLTHTDPKARHGALAVALAAHTSAIKKEAKEYEARLKELLEGEDANEFLGIVQEVTQSVSNRETTMDFCRRFLPHGGKLGVSGYIYHTVPVVLHAWLSHPDDFRKALTNVISCGGDTDTTGAILGGIVGARVGTQGIPEEWVQGILEYPRSISWMKNLARQLAFPENGEKAGEVHFPGLLIRNFLFALIVLGHGLRRIFPPW